MKAEPVTIGADATVYVWLVGQIYTIYVILLQYSYINKSQTYTAISAPALKGSVFMQKFRFF